MSLKHEESHDKAGVCKAPQVADFRRLGIARPGALHRRCGLAFARGETAVVGANSEASGRHPRRRRACDGGRPGETLPDPPPERDAALLLAPAFAAAHYPASTVALPFFDSTFELPPKAQPLPDDLRTNMEAFVNDNQAGLNAIPWDRLTNAWFGSGFAGGFDKGLDDRLYRHFGWLWKTLCLKAILEGESGQGTKAIESLRQALALVHIFSSDTILHHSTRRLGEQRVCDVLERILNRTQISAEDLAAAERALSDDHPDGFRDAFMGVRCVNIFAMSRFRDAPNSVFEDGSRLQDAAEAQVLGSYLRFTGKRYSDADFTDMLDLRAAQIAALKLPLKERFVEFNRLSDHAASQRRQTYAWSFVAITYHWSERFRSDVETLTQLQVTRAALEIERWRLAHGGRAPDSLADLTPQFAPSVPLDPFDNNPLRYRKLPQGFMVYSIGAGLTDDGGKEEPAGDDAATEHYDITFSVVNLVP